MLYLSFSSKIWWLKIHEYRVKNIVYKSDLTLSDAKEKYPEWYQKRIVDKQKKGISAREQIQRKSTKIRQNTGLDIFPRTNGADFCLFTVNGQRVDIHLRQLCQIRC